MSVVIAAHQPCPDLPYHSLTKEDKERGLKLLKRTRAELRERMLTPLREEAKSLTKQGKEAEDPREKAQIKREIDRIQGQARRIQERWS